MEYKNIKYKKQNKKKLFHVSSLWDISRRETSSVSSGYLPKGDKFHGKGFTLIEVIIAIFLLTTGIFGAHTVIQQAIISSSISTSKLSASYLAQEGIEIVRNIRDTNWLEDRSTTTSWDDGLGVGDWEADYNDSSLSSYIGDTLNLETATGIYGYDMGIAIPFTRKITISDKTDLSVPLDGIIDMFKVSVEVSWLERGKTYNIIVQENLYNWK